MGGAFADQESFLETSTTVLSLVFVGFLFASIIFQGIIEGIKKFLRRHKRHGMLVAFEHSVWELTLVGFISLCLIALQGQLTTICVDVSTDRAKWSIIDQVYSAGNCPCCLEHTSGIQNCLLQTASCGNPSDKFCNCDELDPTCVAPFHTDASNFSSSPSTYYPPPPPATAARRRALAAASSSVKAAEPYCVGATTVPPTCGPGKMPAVSFLALEQVHLLIFTVALVHVTSGFLLYLAALMRVKLQWKRWEAADDSHSRAVRAKLQEYYASLDSSEKKVHGGSAILLTTLGEAGSAGVNGAAALENGGDVENQQQGPQLSTAAEEATASKTTGGFAAVATAAATANGIELGQRTVSQALPDVLRGRGRSLSRSLARNFSAISAAEPSAPTRIGKLVEWVKSLGMGLSPFVVTSDEYALMRASYLYTHKLSSQFAFLDHVQRNMEDDLSHIVGLSVEFWAVIIVFVLVSGPYGWAVMPFMAVMGVILFFTNGKIAWVIRRVTSRGGAGRLTSDVFWFKRPQLLLIPIKMALFLCAFIYASFLFFVWQFSAKSCAFTDAFYPGWVLPWWTILLFNSLIFLHMGAVTLPAYSLAVLMGSDVKAHMLPKRFAKKLLAVAAAAKTKVREDKAQQAQQALQNRSLGPIPAELSEVESAAQPAKLAQQEAAAGAAPVIAGPSEENAVIVAGEEERKEGETAVAAAVPVAASVVAERATKATKGGLRRLGSMIAHHMVGHGADHHRRTTD